MINNILKTIKKTIPYPLRDSLLVAILLFLAYLVSRELHKYSGDENNTVLIFVLAVVIISRLTTGYILGFIASVMSVFLINYFFMYPYSTFNFTLTGYPVTLVSMLAVTLVIGGLTSQIKKQTEHAIEREKHTKELYELNERLANEQNVVRLAAEKEKMRGNLLRAISHDLRTPLTSILGASSVILVNGDNLEKAEKHRLLLNIKEDSEWLIRMIENLLSITRINSENARLDKLPEAVEEIVAEAVAKTKKHFPDIKISVKTPEKFMEVPMDAILIEQVLINLLENAIRHSGDLENVSLEVYEEREYAIFEVSDRGKGILMDDPSHIFDKVHLINDDLGDSTRGTGIGLSVCKSIINAHGGYMEAENNSAGGALFRFTLPLKEKSSDES